MRRILICLANLQSLWPVVRFLAVPSQHFQHELRLLLVRGCSHFPFHFVSGCRPAELYEWDGLEEGVWRLNESRRWWFVLTSGE